MKNKKLASHRRPIIVNKNKNKSIKEKIENYDLENIKCNNFSLDRLLRFLKNIKPFFPFN